MDDKVLENKARRKASRLGLVLRKSRARNWSVDNYQGYMLVDAQTNTIVLGEKFNFSLDEVIKYLDEAEAERLVQYKKKP